MNAVADKMAIGTEIFNQLGAGRFKVMTGAKDLVATKNGLRFRIPTSNKINLVDITLEANDTYTVKFYNFRGLNLKLVSEHSEIYCDGLRQLFTAKTGLYTSL